MIVVYVGLLGFLIFFFTHFTKVYIYPALILATIPMMTYGLTIVNVGTIYRMRYVYIMIFVGFGFLAIFNLLKKYRFISF